MVLRFSANGPRASWLCLLLLGTEPAFALESLDEESLSAVSGQSGIDIELRKTSAIPAANMSWVTDSGTSTSCTTGGTANRQGCVLLAPALSGVGGPLLLQQTLDVGSGASNGGVAWTLAWQPLLLQTSSLTLSTPTVDYSSRSVGSLGVYSQGYLRYSNQVGLYNNGGNTARLDFSSSGDVIYRQGAVGQPELSLGNFLFANRFSTGAAAGQADGMGKVAVDSQGLLVTAPYTDSDLLFDLMFKASPGSSFDTASRSPIVQFGWTGGLVNPVVRLGSGGVGYGTYTAGAYTYYDITGTNGGGARSDGLNLNTSWDFDTDFALILGQAGGNRTQARLTNWRRMGGASAVPMLSMPLTFDILQNGAGPAGLCFGGGFASGSPIQGSCTSAGGSWVPSAVPAGKAALGILLRDGHLHAYSQNLEVRDPSSATPNVVYDWSLVTTMGKVDGDFYFYPEGRAPGVALGTTTTGLKADLALAIQSPGFWDKANSSSAAVRATAGAGWATNMHFMFADTKVGGVAGQQYGVGMLNSDLLWTAKDLYFRVTNSDSGYTLIPGGLWLQTDAGSAYRFRGLFGGGNLLDLSAPTSLFLMDMNLSTSRFIFALSPTTPVAGDAPIGFTGLLDLDGNAYLSLGEVSSPSSTFRLSSVSGRIAWKNGTVNLVSGQNSADGLPRLTVSNDLLFGASADLGAGGGAPGLASVGFGSENFGRIVYPGGTWHSDVTIRTPSN